MFILWKSRNQLNKSICTVFYFFTLVLISNKPFCTYYICTWIHTCIWTYWTDNKVLSISSPAYPGLFIIPWKSCLNRLKGKKITILCHHRKISSYRNKHVWLIIFWHGIIYFTLLFGCFFSQWTMKLCLLLTPTNIHKFLWKVNKGID